MDCKCPKIGVLGDFGGVNWIFIFLDPKGHLLMPKHAFWHITRHNRPTGLTRTRYWGTKKIMASAAIFDFQLLFFYHTALLGIRLRLCMPNFIMIGLAVQKLLAFLFSIGNALKVPKNWGFWRFWRCKLNFYLSRPQRAPPCAKTRILTYHSP